MMSEVQAKIIAQVQDEFRLLREELRASDALIESLQLANRLRLERVARLEGLLNALAAFDLSSMVALEKAPEVASGPIRDFEQQSQIPPVTTLTKQEQILLLDPRVSGLKALVASAEQLENEARNSEDFPREKILKPVADKLQSAVELLVQKLQSNGDPSSVFKECGSTAMTVMTTLLTELTQMHSNNLALQPSLLPKVIEELRAKLSSLKPFIDVLWQQIALCAPGVYEKIVLKPNKVPGDQKPQGLPDISPVSENFFRIVARHKDTGVKDEVIETLVPGYCEVKSNGTKHLLRQAWIIVSQGWVPDTIRN